MDFEYLRRRTYLGTVAGAIAGLAGCNSRDDGEQNRQDTTDSQPATAGEPSPEQKTNQQDLSNHDHSSETTGGSSLAPTDITAEQVATAAVNGDIYAAEFPGDDLAAKVRNAIDAAPTGGTIIITPRPDGTPWTWSETLTINLKKTHGLQLLFRGTTMIEYTGDSWAIEITYRPAEYGQLAQGDFLRLRGGNWRAAETANPDGWLRIIDTNFCEIRPERVIDFANDDRTGTGIRLEIQDIFCESHILSGHFAGCDIGLDFVPSDTPGIAGGEAAASFQGNYIDNIKLLNCRRYGIRWRDGAQCQQMTVMNPDSFAGISDDVVDEFVHYYLGGDYDGSVIIGAKAEDAGANNDDYEQNDTMFEVPNAMGTPPLVIMPGPDQHVDEIVNYADRFKTLPALMMWKDGFRWQAGVHTLGRREEQPFFHRGGIDFPATDLNSLFENSMRNGHTVYYDGTSDGIPEGLYRADPENSQWVKVEDNSITVPV